MTGELWPHKMWAHTREGSGPMIPESFLCVFSLSIIGVVGFPLEFFETFPVPPMRKERQIDNCKQSVKWFKFHNIITGRGKFVLLQLKKMIEMF